MRNRFGFSLLELLIVVAVIAILAAAAIPNFGKAAERSRIQDAKAVLAAIASAEKVYFLDQSSYGTLNNLKGNGYLTDPNPSADWTYTATIGTAPSTTYAAAATRIGSTGKSVSITQNFNGSNYTCSGYDSSLCP